MKKNPQKKYKPGELARTRNNLGAITEEEARKMLGVLGGEIGIEQAPEDLEREARRIRQAEERRKRIELVTKMSEEASMKPGKMWAGSGERETRQLVKKRQSEKEKIGYLDRIRIDYLSHKPEHRLKSAIGVLSSFFAFFPDSPDYINPLFVRNADELFFFSLGLFVRSIRGLFSKAKPDVYREISRNSFYANILATLKMWDIEGINIELAMLQRNPYRADTVMASGLVRKLYRPFGVLIYLEYDVQIRHAIRWAYEMNIAMTPPENRTAWKTIIKNFETAMELLPVVFSDVKKMLYPLLLKLSSRKFYFFEEYFAYERRQILRFLALSPENVINPRDEKSALSRQDPGQKDEAGDCEPIDAMNDDPDENTGDEKAVLHGQGIATRRDFERGVSLLDALFPGAGLARLSGFPDLYPYFQPLFEFPQGFELVPQSDPLQQVVVICTIVSNLLYGFRHIGFGSLRMRNPDRVKDKEEIEALFMQWPMFLEETVFKTYIARLVDYCRNIEKDPSFTRSELGRKAVRELEFIKRIHVLPYLKAEAIFYSAVPSKKNSMKFFEVVRETREVLLGITAELDALPELPGSGRDSLSKTECNSVHNPADSYVFDLANPVSKRLDWIAMKGKKHAHAKGKGCDDRTNADIIRTCLTLVSVVDYLVNSKASHFYASVPVSVYRTGNENAQHPEYSVRLMDTHAILRKYEAEKERECEPPPAGTQPVDNAGLSFVRPEETASRLKRDIEEYRVQPFPFSFVFICIAGVNDIDDALSLKLEETVKKEIRPGRDLYMRLSREEALVRLKNTDLALAKTIGMKIVGRLVPLYELRSLGLQASCGVLQYMTDWDLGMLMNVIEKVKRVVRKQTSPRLVFLEDGVTLKGIPV